MTPTTHSAEPSDTAAFQPTAVPVADPDTDMLRLYTGRKTALRDVDALTAAIAILRTKGRKADRRGDTVAAQRFAATAARLAVLSLRLSEAAHSGYASHNLQGA